jgi:hypothetical protein
LTERYLGLVAGGSVGGLLGITRIHRVKVLKDLDGACSIHHYVTKENRGGGQ